MAKLSLRYNLFFRTCFSLDIKKNKNQTGKGIADMVNIGKFIAKNMAKAFRIGGFGGVFRPTDMSIWGDALRSQYENERKYGKKHVMAHPLVNLAIGHKRFFKREWNRTNPLEDIIKIPIETGIKKGINAIWK